MILHSFTIRLSLLLLFVMSLAVACDKKTASHTDHNPAHLDAAHHDTAHPEVLEATQGKELDPPIEVAQVPSGHWYCDMGTVHYHSPEKGDGKCPICGMLLKHKD